MSLCFVIHCPICGEPMVRGIDHVAKMITIDCQKCDRYAGVRKGEVALSLHAIGMSFSLRDVRMMLQIFVEAA